MLDDERPTETDPDSTPAPAPTRSRRRSASRPAGPPAEEPTAAPPAEAAATPDAPAEDEQTPTPRKRATKRTTKRAEPAFSADAVDVATTPPPAAAVAPVALFQAPELTAPAPAPALTAAAEPDAGEAEEGQPRRRRRGGRGRRRSGEDTPEETSETQPESGDEASASDEAPASPEGGEGTATSRRRRRRRKSGAGDESGSDDPERTVVHVRQPRSRDASSEITSVKGSTRLEAKKQRRREGREQGRRRPPLLTEAEFLARRESVERVMVVRQLDDRTQIAVLEDDVLVEHYVARRTATALAGNVYLGRVQNVLPSMEAAFVDIGRGRNAVLYAGEVNWDLAGLEGQPRRIEHAMKSGDALMVQVTKDPLGHKGARLTAQVSLPGRYLVYVPDGSMTGISRKLPDTERSRLKSVLKRIVPEDAGVIVRTAAEGASEEELQRDVDRLAAQWQEISAKAESASAPALLHEEPDLTVRVIRDVFNEDFASLVVSGDDAWETIQGYVSQVAPDLVPRLTKWTDPEDVFTARRVDEQLAKALDRKVWLPSGGYLIIDPTEAMTVIDVNTGKFTGVGGNLEETVTKNNIEAAEEIVRQLRLRDIGGIIVVDFIDMVLESNRDLVLRRLMECLGRDRTKHQVAEVTSLGLVQMTRKRVGQGLLEAFSTPCEACNGRGRIVHTHPVEPKRNGESGAEPKRSRGSKRKRASAEETRDPAKDAAAAAAVASIAAASLRASTAEAVDAV